METIKKVYEPTPNCPVDYAFNRIGGKYKGRVLWMLRDGALRYGQIRKLTKGISPKMLTQVLRELEEDQLVTRTVYNEVPPRVEYRLTEIANGLLPSIQLLTGWGEQQMKLNGIGTGH